MGDGAKGKRAVIYARYSSDMQREESIAAQLRAAQDYCKKRGYTVIREYCDEAKSGRTDNRPQYQMMLADARRKRFDVIVFHKVDRNARNEYDYYFHKAQLTKLGISLEYAAQNIDDSPEGSMMEAMLVGMAAYYSRNLAKEVTKGLNENAYKVKFNGGTPPLGYDIKDGRYIINEYESCAIKMIFNMYKDGYGYAQIIDELNRNGFKTKVGKKFGKNSLHSILRNRRYVGDYFYGKVNTRPDGTRNSHSVSENMIVVENSIPAIISRSVFDMVLCKMQANRHRNAAFKAKTIYALSGLLKCGECGANMVGKTTSARGNRYQYYKCGAQERRSSSDCHNKMVNLIDLEDIVIAEIEREFFDPVNLEKMIKGIVKRYNKHHSEFMTQKEILLKDKDIIAKKMDNLYCRIEDGVADDYDMDRLKAVKKDMDIIKTKLIELEVKSDYILDIDQVYAVIESFKGALKNKKDPDQLRALFQNFISHIVISEENITIQFKMNVCDIIGAEEGT